MLFVQHFHASWISGNPARRLRVVQLLSMLSLNVFVTSLILLVSSHSPDGSSVSKTGEGGDLLRRQENTTANAHSNSGWVACNSPPKYWIPVTVRDCAILYNRYAAEPTFETLRTWNAIRSPWTLSTVDEVCVLRLENYDRRRIDAFSTFDIFSAAFRALGQCSQGVGGAASVGSELFFASVAGAIPAVAEGHNVTFVAANDSDSAGISQS